MDSVDAEYAKYLTVCSLLILLIIMQKKAVSKTEYQTFEKISPYIFNN